MAVATDEGPDAAPVSNTWQRLADGGKPLVSMLVLALVVKLLVMAVTLDESPLGTHITSDARYYVDRAQGLAGDHDDPRLDEVYHLPPLYPALLSVLPGVVDESYASVLVFQLLAGVVLLACVFVLARRRGNTLAGLVAVGLTLSYAPLTYFETRLLGDQLATVLLIAGLVAADSLHDRPTPWRAALSGLLLGLTCLLRPQALLLLFVMALWSLRLKRRVWPALVLAAALPFVPVVWHNASASGQFVLISDNGGINLWLANAGPPSGTFLTFEKDFGSIETQADVARTRAQFALGRTLGPAEVSRWYAGQAWDAISADPGLFGRRVWLRARALLETFETGVVVVPPVEMALVPPLRMLVLPFGVLAALFGAAMVLLWRARRPDQNAGLARAPALPGLALAGMVVVTTLLFYQYSRFRLPLVPLMAVTIGLAVQSVRSQAPGVLRALLALVLAVAVGWVSWLPNSHHAGVLANGFTILAEARRGLASQHDSAAIEQAYADAQTALEHDPGFVRAQLVAAELALALQRFDATDRYLDRAEPALGDDATGLFVRAVLCLHGDPRNRHRDPERAATIIEQLHLMAVGEPGLHDMIAILERMAGQDG
jgi:hypothetical protein